MTKVQRKRVLARIRQARFYTKRRRLKKKDPFIYLCLKYKNMAFRVSGIKRKDRIYYKNLPILSREEFLDAYKEDKSFLRIFRNWVFSGHEFLLQPSPDRIDPDKGYTLDNIEWVTLRDNLKRVSGT